MATDLSRRGLLTGLISFTAAAPAIVKAGSLMPVKALPPVRVWTPEQLDLLIRPPLVVRPLAWTERSLLPGAVSYAPDGYLVRPIGVFRG